MSAVGRWNGWGTLLAHGSAFWRDKPLQLVRTGPFIPAVTLAGIGPVVITTHFKETLESAGVSGWSPEPLVKKKIVRLNWESWPKDSDLPAIMPRDGEMWNYLEDGSHDEAAALALGELYELIPEKCGLGVSKQVTRAPRAQWRHFVDPCGAELPDIFQADGMRRAFVSSKVVALLGDNYEWIKFEPVEIGPLPPQEPIDQDTVRKAKEFFNNLRSRTHPHDPDDAADKPGNSGTEGGKDPQ